MTLNCAANSAVMFPPEKVERFCTLGAAFDIFIVNPEYDILFMLSSFASCSGQLRYDFVKADDQFIGFCSIIVHSLVPQLFEMLPMAAGQTCLITIKLID